MTFKDFMLFMFVVDALISISMTNFLLSCAMALFAGIHAVLFMRLK